MKRFIFKDDWLESIFKSPVFKLKLNSDLIKNLKNKESEEYKQFNKIIHFKNVFLYTKIRTSDIDVIKFLVDFGFYLIDTNVIFKKKIKINHLKDIKNNDLSIRFAGLKDKEETTKLSRESFIYSRFHQDEKIPNKIANSIKFKWVENFFYGKRGDDLIIATLDDKVIGFILLIIEKINKNITIDLIAVHKEFRGKNIAKDMISFLENNFNDYNHIIVGTQIVNIPSINLYESCGFQIDESYYVFHYHHK